MFEHCVIQLAKGKIKVTFNSEYNMTTQEQYLNPGRESIPEDFRNFTFTRVALLIHNESCCFISTQPPDVLMSFKDSYNPEI